MVENYVKRFREDNRWQEWFIKPP